MCECVADIGRIETEQKTMEEEISGMFLNFSEGYTDV